MAQSNLEVVISARDNFTATANKVIGSLGRMNAAAGKIGGGVARTAGGIARIGAVVGAAVIGLGAGAVKLAVSYEDAFAGVRKTIDEADLIAAGTSFDELSRQFIDMSTKIPIAATTFAQLGETAGALGIKAEDIREFVEVTALLGVTTNLTAEDAATQLGKLGTILGLTGKEYRELADTIVNLGNKGSSTETEIVDIAKRFAGTARQAGLAKEEILALASAAASLGLEPQAAGGSLSRIFSNMATDIALANDAGKSFAKVTGRSLKDLTKDINKGNALPVFLSFLKGLGKLDRIGVAKALDAAGITGVRDRDAILKMAANLGFVTDQLDIAKDSAGALGEESQKRFDTIASKLETLRNTAIKAALAFAGDPSDPKTLSGSIGVVAEKLRLALLDPKVGSDLASLGADFAKAISSIDFGELISTARSMVTVFKDDVLPVLATAWEWFNKLPGSVKALTASLLILSNTPVIGGAFKDILGGLGQIGSGILEGAGRATVGKLLPQPVMVMNWPPGFGGSGGIIPADLAKGGLISKIIKLIPATLIATAILGSAVAIGEALNSFFGVDKDTPREGEKILDLPGGGELRYGGQSNRTPVPLPAPDPRPPQQTSGDPRLNPVNTPQDHLNRERSDGLVAAVRQAGEDGSNKTVAAIRDINWAATLHPDLMLINESIKTGGKDPDTRDEIRKSAETGKNAARTNAERFRGSVSDGASRTVSAIRSIRPPTVNTTVNVNVTAGQVTQSINQQTLYGPPGGSGGGGGKNLVL